MKPLLVRWWIAFIVLTISAAFAAPGLINYQGRLANAAGQPITAAANVTFTFWTSETSGTQLGAFTDTDAITPDANGIYSTFIGDDPGNLVSPAIFNAESVWLNVRVNGEDLVPRKRVASVGYAFRSTRADTLSGLHATDFMPSDRDDWVDATGDSMTGALNISIPSIGNILTALNYSTISMARAVRGSCFGSGPYTNYGGYFEASGETGSGVYGTTIGDRGIGVEGVAWGGNALAVKGHAIGAGAGPTYGGHFTSHSRAGRGMHAEVSGDFARAVEGIATNTGSDRHYGGYFEADGDNAIGVYSEADWESGIAVYGHVEGRTSIGGYFESGGNTGHAVHGKSYGANNSTVRYAGYFEATGNASRGVFASASGYDFYAGGSGTNYGPFTGGHEVRLDPSLATDIQPGLIVSTAGQAQVRRDEKGKISLSSTLPTVRLASKPKDKAVFGVLVSEMPLPEDHWYKSAPGERFGVVNALGEGRVWVCNATGPIEMGDYVTTSAVPGYGQNQQDDTPRAWTVGKVTESVDWNSVTETVQHNGQSYKVCLIAVVYTSG